jgi:predicted DNA-binding transcriptional regulator YafY
MSKNKDAFIRYRLIDQALRNKYKPFPSLQELVAKCETVLGKEFSESTIQKDIYSMRFDEGVGFHAPIEFSKSHGGYYYTEERFSISGIPLREEEIVALQFAAGLLAQYKDVNLLRQFETAIEKIIHTVDISQALNGDKIDDIVQMEQVSFFKGNEHLEKLILAIINKQVISFSYTNFFTKEAKTHIIHPYVLREYRNRWYLIGWHEEIKKIRTFGLDRISVIKDEKMKFHREPSFKAKEFFKHSFGITVDQFKAEEIILSFDPFQGNYVKAQPIHGTQKILKDNDDELLISINVIPSQELNMQILSYGDSVQVVKPKKLRVEMENALSSALKQYK